MEREYGLSDVLQTSSAITFRYLTQAGLPVDVASFCAPLIAMLGLKAELGASIGLDEATEMTLESVRSTFRSEEEGRRSIKEVTSMIVAALEAAEFSIDNGIDPSDEEAAKMVTERIAAVGDGCIEIASAIAFACSWRGRLDKSFAIDLCCRAIRAACKHFGVDHRTFLAGEHDVVVLH